ncbi:hypothetical protein SAMN02982929_07201 [Saccharopolyspora kobensis]|uniref:Uncharacterized protein n=1 Tax=Saccharopolyspora kobensis TaxID=146035 RepID=A0A1H6ELI3_9PSEU|nr:hypothetical protein [Saccharopolyspora kobensis]SEG98720.1 hypothetical protein SAMN02982929_07201 [Saccharopolyspora kobensis]SFD23438.1 hypothetical protein SAMN05216506_103167 [Saccharopolyspora kobensis]
MLRSIARSFARHFDGLRFILAVLAAAVFSLAVFLTSPGSTWHPFSPDHTTTPSTASVTATE